MPSFLPIMLSGNSLNINRLCSKLCSSIKFKIMCVCVCVCVEVVANNRERECPGVHLKFILEHERSFQILLICPLVCSQKSLPIMLASSQHNTTTWPIGLMPTLLLIHHYSSKVEGSYFHALNQKLDSIACCRHARPSSLTLLHS